MSGIRMRRLHLFAEARTSGQPSELEERTERVQAVRIHEFGGRDVLTVEEVPDPEPGPGPARLQVEVGAPTRVEVDPRGGFPRFGPTPPPILGREPVGRIDRLGPGADGLAVGDRVM